VVVFPFMKSLGKILFFIGITIGLCAFAGPEAAFAHSCTVTPLKRPYKKSTPDHFYYVVDFPANQGEASVPQGHFPFLARFQERVKTRGFSLKVKDLIRHQKDFYQNFPEDRKLFERVLKGEFGKLRPIRCMEAFLLDAHLSHLKEKSEFQALVLVHPKHSMKRLIVSSQNEEMGVRPDQKVESLMETFLKQGWRLEEHLHNHPFDFENPYGDIAGTPIPSPPDLENYRFLRSAHKLQTAVIINGFDAIQLNF